MSFPQAYQTDGVQTVWSFDFPYLDRSHIFVTVNAAPRAFSFVDDHTLKVVDLFGNPLAAGLPLKIFRVTPDLVEFAAFKDAANLTAEDLNRARLQVLFLVQERSGGIAGSVGTVIQLISNEIETISGALDSLAETQGVLQAGLQTLGSLSGKVTAIENGAKALQDQINQEIAARDAADSQLASRLDSLSLKTDTMSASFHSDVNLLQSGQAVLASKTDALEAKLDSLDSGDDDGDQDVLAASIINSAIASVKKDVALAKQVTTLEADLNGNVKALLQTEQTARVTADEALAQQITTLQAQIGDNLAQVIQEMKTRIDSTDGKVTGLTSQYTLKTSVKREDGRQVMAGIGLAATSNDDYTGSEILLMADKVLFVNPNSVNGGLVPVFEVGTVDGAATLVVPATNVGDKTLPGRVLVDGSVEARTIKANSITADKLVAGSITTDKLAVGLGVNLLPFTEFIETTDGQHLRGWGISWSGNIGQSGADWGKDLNGTWTVVGGHTAWLHSPQSNGDTDRRTSYYLLYTDMIPVMAGTRYEFSAYMSPLGCDGDIGVWWLDSRGAIIATSGLDGDPACYAPRNTAGAANVLGQYTRAGSFAVAPANAVGAKLVCRKSLGSAASPDTWLFVTRPMIAETTPNATRLAPYGPGGLGTLITASGISTPSLSALSATIGLLRTATSGQRLEIDNNQVRVYDSNNVMRVRLGIW